MSLRHVRTSERRAHRRCDRSFSRLKLAEFGECGVSGVTVTEVKGCGAQRGYTEKYRGASVHISLRPRLKVEAVMKSEIVTTVVDKLAVAGRTGDGEVGDGKIFVIGVEDAVRIRTGEHGPETVQHAERAMWGH